MKLDGNSRFAIFCKEINLIRLFNLEIYEDLFVIYHLLDFPKDFSLDYLDLIMI